MKAATDLVRRQRVRQLSAVERAVFVARYDALLVVGLAANTLPGRGRRRRGRIKQSPMRNFMERLWLGKEQVLAFLDNLAIPFDNNQAERDLRMLKVQQKLSGSFRSSGGAAAFAHLRDYLSTLRKQRVALLPALETIFTGLPWYPALG